MKIKKSDLTAIIREVLLEAEQTSVFDINTVDKFMEDLKNGLRFFPHVKVSKMTLGGDERVTVFAHLSLDDPKTWTNKIYHNSRYLIVSFSRDGIIKQTSNFSSRETKTKFRKSRFKDLKGAVAKLKQWRDKHKNTKNYW